MSNIRPDGAVDPLDPSVPLETVEEWVAAPGSAAPVQTVVESTYQPELVQPAAATEYVTVPEVAEVPVQTVQVTPVETTEVYASAPTETFAPEVTETVVTETDTGARVIEPVRSPGIVLPAPEPKPEVVADEADEAVDEVAEEPTRPLSRRLLPWLLLVVGVLAALTVLAQLVPRWWSEFIANLVDGYTARGAGWGAAIGFVFTYAATMLIGHAVHKWQSWKAPLALVIGGLVVAAPNLFTLWINHGPTTAAQTANALLDRSAPLFRGASLAGAAAGLVLGILTTVLYRVWRRRTRRLKAMESLVDEYA